MLSDFGVSRLIATSHTTTSSNLRCSTRWMARELCPKLDGAPSDGLIKANEKSDVWAFGMTVYVSNYKFPLVADDNHFAGDINRKTTV
jgi:serine/threonine protein kinase